MTSASLICSVPLIQAGVSTGAVVRREDRAHHLLQDQADAEGREQRLERPAVEEADRRRARCSTPTSAGDQERRGNRHEDRRADVLRHQRLHDVGRVGAEHHQLAVRHVDDAHHAEGDGEADRDEHQHRAEAQAEEQRLDGAVEAARELSMRERAPPRARRARAASGSREVLPSGAARPGARQPVADARRSGARASVRCAASRRAATRARERRAPSAVPIVASPRASRLRAAARSRSSATVASSSERSDLVHGAAAPRRSGSAARSSARPAMPQQLRRSGLLVPNASSASARAGTAERPRR